MKRLTQSNLISLLPMCSRAVFHAASSRRAEGDAAATHRVVREPGGEGSHYTDKRSSFRDARIGASVNAHAQSDAIGASLPTDAPAAKLPGESQFGFESRMLQDAMSRYVAARQRPFERMQTTFHSGPTRGKSNVDGRAFRLIDAGTSKTVVLMALPQPISLLEELEPGHVVLYGPDLDVVRQLEVFQAWHAPRTLRVYLLVYTDSVEQQWFMSRVDKETEAFKNLIRAKGTMTMSRHESTREAEDLDSDSGSISTRIGGGMRQNKKRRRQDSLTKKRRRIIVDVREFRSSLPSLLHSNSFDISAVTLTIGDYILSPKLCVERKSVSDLIQSLNSGRLYNQAEAMLRHYENAILLIEFDESRSFSLQSNSSISNRIVETSITSKLSLLVLHFPRLRIVWCRSPHMTVKLFRRLKEHHEEPSADEAVQAGVPKSELDGPAWRINDVAREFLLRLPGINLENIYPLIRHVSTVAALAQMSLKQLQAIIGNSNGEELHAFLRNRTLASSSSDSGHSQSDANASGGRTTR